MNNFINLITTPMCISYTIIFVQVNRKLCTPPFLGYIVMILFIKSLLEIMANMFNKNLLCINNHQDYK